MNTIPKTSILVGGTFICFLVTVFYKQWIAFLGLHADVELLPTRLHTLVTHALAQPSLRYWLLSSLSLVCSGLLIERDLRGYLYWCFVLLATFVAGVSFVLFVPPPAILIGSGGVTFAFGGAVLVFGFVRWRDYAWLARIYVLWMAFSLFVTSFGLLNPENAGTNASYLFACAFGMIVASWRLKNLADSTAEP
jgi:hypothetical protein